MPEIATNSFEEVDAEVRRAGGHAKNLLGRFFATLIPVFLATITVYFWAGGWTNAFHKIRGESVVITPATFDLGDVNSGSSAKAAFELTNLTSAPIKIVGAETTCHCTGAVGLPVDVAARNMHVLQAEISLGDDPGGFQQRVTYFIDCGNGIEKFPVWVTGVVSD